MSVIVLILKIVGLVLLALLGLALLVLALALGVPVRYRVDGEREERVRIQVKVTWLLHLISFRLRYEDGSMAQTLRICGIPLFQRAREPSGETAEDGQDIREPESAAEEPSRESESAAEEPSRAPESAAEETIGETGASPDASVDGQELSQRARRFGRDPVRRMRERLSGVREACRQLVGKLSSLREMLSDEANRTVFAKVLAELRYLLRHFRMRKVDADVRFGLGDPAATGQALGALSVVPLFYRYPCRVVPDFETEETYVKGRVQIAGRARGVHIVLSLIRLWGKKEVRTLVKKALR